MKNLTYKAAAFGSFLILSYFSVAWASGFTYNRSKAVTYAGDHCKTATYNHDKYKCYNPKDSRCENYKKGGGTDCANFVSQALIDGGISFSDCLVGKGTKAIVGELVAGADVTGKDGKVKGLILANDLITALQKSYCFKQVSASEAKEGDIVAWRIKGRNWVHHVAILDKEGYYAGHTSDVCFVCGERGRAWIKDH
jgi:hypothetical protein